VDLRQGQAEVHTKHQGAVSPGNELELDSWRCNCLKEGEDEEEGGEGEEDESEVGGVLAHDVVVEQEGELHAGDTAEAGDDALRLQWRPGCRRRLRPFG